VGDQVGIVIGAIVIGIFVAIALVSGHAHWEEDKRQPYV